MCLDEDQSGHINLPSPSPPDPWSLSLEDEGGCQKGLEKGGQGGGDLALIPLALVGAALIWHTEPRSRLHTLCKCAPLNPCK